VTTLNAYAVFALWSCAVRAALGALVAIWAFAGARAWRRQRRGLGTVDEAARAAVEDRYSLLFLAAVVLLGLVWLGWPLYYVVLSSYVPSWPGAMCVYGITQIGRGSLGASRVLPALVVLLEALKPAVVFVWGLWLLTYLANRRTATAPLTGRVLGLLVLLGALGVGEAVAEGAWLVIPKSETFAKAGCCTAAPVSHTVSAVIAPLSQTRGARAMVLVLHAGLLLGLIVATRRLARGAAPLDRPAHSGGRLLRWGVVAGAAGVLVSGVLFLRDTAAPWLTGLPHHRCLDCLLATRPETCVAVLGLVAGCFLTGWSVAATRLGRGVVGRDERAALAWPGRLGRAAAACLGGYALMIAWQLVLARW
jgi:hypothetical protein